MVIPYMGFWIKGFESTTLIRGANHACHVYGVGSVRLLQAATGLRQPPREGYPNLGLRYLATLFSFPVSAMRDVSSSIPLETTLRF